MCVLLYFIHGPPVFSILGYNSCEHTRGRCEETRRGDREYHHRQRHIARVQRDAGCRAGRRVGGGGHGLGC